MYSFGERLVSIRENKGISQKRLADLLEISPTRLNYWEKNKRQPDIDMIRKIAFVLDVSFVELLEWGEREQKIREEAAFDSYLKSLGYTVEHEVIKWHWEDETASPEDRVQVPDEWIFTLTKDGKSVIFDMAEFEEIKSGTKDVIETRFYKKIMEKRK